MRILTVFTLGALLLTLTACGASGSTGSPATASIGSSTAPNVAVAASATSATAPTRSRMRTPTALQRWVAPVFADFRQMVQLFGNTGDGSALRTSDCNAISVVAAHLNHASPAPDATVRRSMNAVVIATSTAAEECRKDRSVAATAYLYDGLKSVASVISRTGLAGPGGFTIPPVPDTVKVGFWFSKLQDVLPSLPQKAGDVSIDLTTQRYGGGGTPNCASLTKLRSELRKTPPPDYVSIVRTWDSLLTNLATEASACTSGKASTAANAADNITGAAYQLIDEVRAIAGGN